MLERASTCLETGGRQLLRSSKRCPRSRRMLHSSFWHHGAGDLSLPTWWTAIPSSERGNGDIDDCGEKGTNARGRHNYDGLLLDFLYPEKTLALMQSMSKYGADTLDSRRRRPMNGNSVRQFSTTRWKAKRVDTDLLDPKEIALQEEVEERLLDSTADKALQRILATREPGKQELALRLYLAIHERNHTAKSQADLLEYLASSPVPVEANRILRIFDALPTEERRASSYRTAISAYLALEMVGAAVQLHEDAASRNIGADIGTGFVLGRTVKDNQWDLSLRVFKTFIHSTLGNKFNTSRWYQDPNRERRDPMLVWGIVAGLPYLRGNLISLFLYIKQFRHELLSADENKEALEHFIFGLAAETMEQVLNTDPPDEDFIWDFMVGTFHELRAIGLSSPDLYEYAIGRMLNMQRYREYTNLRKTFLELYRLYRDEMIQNPDPKARPTRELLRKLIVQVGEVRSVTGVENLVSDLRLFYPSTRIPHKTLKYLINFYAEFGQVDQVHEFFDNFKHHYPSELDLRILTALPYAYSRRVDVKGTEKQFRRISEEFGMKPDTACWNTLLLVYTRADDLDGALVCFNSILDSGSTPDIYTFGPLLDLCAARGDVEAFEALYSKAEQLKIPIRADVKARSGYVQACLASDDPEGAEATALAMLKSQRAGTLRGHLTHTWNLLIQHYALKGDVTSGRRLYRQMVENHIPLNSWTYGSLMRALVEVRQTNAAYKILRVTMPNNHMKVHAFHYALVITGFLREGQYDHAMRAHKRMMDRGVMQTPSSYTSSLQAIGLTQLRQLREEKDHDPKTRLIAVEESLREILFTSYESAVANREPRHSSLIDSKEHSVPEGYFGLLILLYGARGAFDICKELFEAATMAKANDANYQAPISLLTAIMDAHYRAEEYDEVAKCWELARSQADKLVKTLQQIVNPEAPKVEFDSLIDPAIRENFEAARLATNRRQVLVRATRIYIRSLLSRRDQEGLQEAQRTIRNLLTNGYVVDNLTWNEFIQMLARHGRILDAFSACEAYLMPAFPGWRQLNPYYIRRNQPGFIWMELRHTDINKRTIMPRYKTLVILAAAYAQVRKDEANGMGYNPEMGGWAREVLEQISPMTVRAIETMPRTGDRLQMRFLAGT